MTLSMEEQLITSTDKLDLVTDTLLKCVSGGDWIFLTGNLGSGKTTLVKNLAARLGSQEEATSPTFSIANAIPVSKSPFSLLLHIDLYRIEDPADLLFLGLEQHLSPHTLAVFEWANLISTEDWEKLTAAAGWHWPPRIVEVEIEFSETENVNQRRYRILCGDCE